MSVNARYWDNNCLTQDAIDAGRLTFSSETSGFEFSNAFNDFRSIVWKPAGNFEIGPNNKKIYFNDGVSRTATLDEGSYTGDTLATEIALQMNVVGSGWACVYNSDFEFKISNPGGFTMNYSNGTNAIWDTIGHDYGYDKTETTFNELAIRRHTSEWFELDSGASLFLGAIGSISELGDQFNLSNTAQIKIQANNVPLWDSPPVDQVIARRDSGAFAYIEDSYRYHRFSFVDRENTQEISIGYMYLGSYSTTTTTNVASGFSRTKADPSRVQTSEFGARFFEEKTKFNQLSGMSYDVLLPEDRRVLEDLYSAKGVSRPFFLDIDPVAAVSEQDEFLYFVRFDSAPTFTNLFRDKWTTSLSFREVIS